MGKDKYKEELICLEEGQAPSADAGIFGSPYSLEDARVVVLACPWEATASFGQGTSLGPRNILRASHQLDLEHPVFGQVYKQGLALDLSLEKKITLLNQQAGFLVQTLREGRFEKQSDKKNLQKQVNAHSVELNELISKRCQMHLEAGKKLCLLGGDHSSSYGLVKALSQFEAKPFSILHIDAHFDLREAYEGFEHSHASIMFNLAKSFPNIKKITHVAIRDYCKQEINWTKEHSERSQVFLDQDIQRRLMMGESFARISEEIVQSLASRVYISFDIDGLKPDLCPQTGTPVPGGLDYPQVSYLFELLKASGKEIIAADLLEVAGGENAAWDGNVAARLLYQLCGLLTASA